MSIASAIARPASTARRDLALVALALPVLALSGAVVALAGERFGALKLVWVLAAALAGLVAIRDIRIAVAVLVLALAFPFRTAFGLGVELHTTHGLLVVVILQLVLLAAARRLAVPRGLLLPSLVILVGGLIGAIAGPDTAGGVQRLAFGILLAMLGGLAAAVSVRSGGVGRLPVCVAVGLVGTSLVGFAQFAGVAPAAIAPLFEPGRVNGLFQHPNIFGGFLSATTLLLVGTATFAWRRFPLAPVLFLVPACIGTAALAVTLSRGALVGMVAGILVILAVLAARRRTAPLLIALLGVAVTLAAALPQVPQSQRESFVQRFEQLRRPGSESGRTLIYKQAQRVIAEHRVTGVGPLTFGVMVRDRVTVGGVNTSITHAHSILWESWLSLGLAGMAGLLWLLVGAIRRLLAVTRMAADDDPLAAGWALGTLAALVALLVQGSADFLFWQIEPLVLVFVLIGTAYALYDRAGGSSAGGAGGGLGRRRASAASSDGSSARSAISSPA